MKNIPKKIYLNFGFDKDEVDENDDFNDMTDVLWSTDKINDADLEYELVEQDTINVKISQSDIGIIEVLHDKLLEDGIYNLNDFPLKRARELSGKMYKAYYKHNKKK